MKKLILLLFVFGLLACGEKKQETKAVEETVKQETVTSIVDSTVAADSTSKVVEEVAE
jgi:hypothetical protein